MVRAGELLETETTRKPERVGSQALLRSPCNAQVERAAEQWTKAQDQKPPVGQVMDRSAAAADKPLGPVESKPAAVLDRQDVAQCIPPVSSEYSFGSAPTQREHSVALELRPLGRVQGTALGSAHDTMDTGQSPRRDFPAR